MSILYNIWTTDINRSLITVKKINVVTNNALPAFLGELIGF